MPVSLEAVHAEHLAHVAMRAGQWAHDHLAPDPEPPVIEREAEPEPAPPAQHRPLFDLAAAMAELKEAADAHAAKFPESSRYAFEAGFLTSKLQRVSVLIDMLQRELQTAINDGICGSYVSGGHLDRVERCCGVTVPEGYRNA